MKLSVVIPLYNSAQWMRRCLDSLLQQDIPQDEYELICVNDGSTDNSIDIANKYAARFSCVKVLSQRNQGASAARNAGIKAATGKYLCFVDPDDYVKTNSLKVLIDRMEAETLDILRFGYQMVDEQYEPCMPYKHYQEPDLTSGIITGKDYLCSRLGYSCFIWTYIYRTALIKDNNLYCSVGVYFDDTDWLPKVFLHAQRVDCIDFVRHYYLIRSGSLVNTQDPLKKRTKLDGSLQIIGILADDKNKTDDKAVRRWYQQMITVHALSALTEVAIDFYPERKQWIEKLRKFDAFSLAHPINRYRVGNKFKLLLMAASPELFCRLIHHKNYK